MTTEKEAVPYCLYITRQESMPMYKFRVRMATSEMPQENQPAEVVLPVADDTEGGLVDSAGQRLESQNARLEINIGDNRTMVIEITLTGKLALQCLAGAASTASRSSTGS